MSEQHEIPSSWRWSTLSASCDKIQDGTHFSPDQDKQLPVGMYPYVTAKNVRPSGLDLMNLTYLEENEHRKIYERCDPKTGDVLLVKDGVNMGDAAINTIEGEISLLSSVCMLRPRKQVLAAEFLRYYILSPQGFRSLTGQMTGTAIKRVILRKIRETPVPIAPLNEQRRIVAKIEELFSDLDAGVAALKRAKANLKRYRAAVLKAAVDGKLAEEGQHDWFKNANWIEIGTLLTCVEQGWSPKCEREPSLSDDEWAVMKTSAVLPMQFLAHENKRLPISLAPETQFEVKAGDLLITRAGPRNRAAVTCLVRSSRPRLIVCDKVYRIRCDSLKVMPSYLEVVLNSPPLLDELDEMKTGISDSGVNLTQQKFRRLKIPVPPLQSQRRIVDDVEERLSVATVAESEIDNSLLRASRLRQSILKQSFEGKLVPQDPNDEPASVLLERLRASHLDHDTKNKEKNNARPAKRKKSERMVDK